MLVKTPVFSYRKCFAQLCDLLSPSFGDEAIRNPQLSFSNKRSTLIGVSLISNLLSLALPIMTLQVYDRILVNESKGTLQILIAGVVIAVMLESVLRLCRSYVINWAGAVSEHTLLCNTMRHMLGAELSSIEGQTISEQLQRINSISKIREFTSGQALITLIDLPFVILFLILIAYLAGLLVFVPIILLLLFGVVAWYLGIQLKNALVQQEAATESRMGFVIESLNGIHTLKSMGLERLFQRHYEQLQYNSSLSSYQVAKQSNIAANCGALFTQAMMISIVFIGAPMTMNGELTMGTLIACVLLSGRIMSPVQKALSIWTRFQDFQLSKKEIQSTFLLPSLKRVNEDELGEKDGQLNIKNMSFSYGEYESILFDDISLNLHRGESISISGDHSCGKMTLLKLISGLYSPTSGDILVNNAPATSYPARELIQHVGYMAMEGTIFKGTIMQNLTAFDEISMKKVNEIIDLLGIQGDISRLPEGFDTKLEGGTADPIPPGLKQRIAIARVLASKPRILLFDNADRALDQYGYNQLYRLLARLKGKVTMILVSDDRNILRLAQKEYVLEDGHLVERRFSDRSKQHDVLPYQELRL
ncbi:hypothetical protein AB835_07960 [Candidatus Endobugula sertula]|uniref:ABC transporter n=1 Tax=Candidatus Endobugula sertula TaxID=62101 RepID=A0A1D2QPW9_9GAMM|nr:hypothetical protein AB835_07960 [Candidatus Endobugula sertula]